MRPRRTPSDFRLRSPAAAPSLSMVSDAAAVPSPMVVLAGFCSSSRELLERRLAAGTLAGQARATSEVVGLDRQHVDLTCRRRAARG